MKKIRHMLAAMAVAVLPMAAGTYSITWTQVQGAIGAGAFIIETATVPVPATGVLLLGALGDARGRPAA